mmetsp:Transcript_20350/g.60230  ORF Transcript_20350/g.60230 Transcript_20350/m.60230 type:complete len:577 (+) Transcript_20350:104-1834(+)
MADLHVGNIACCLCGVPTSASTAYEGMCATCTGSQVDITSGIERSVEIEMCKGCERWFRNPGWAVAQLESAELLTLCLRKLRGLKHVRLVDAAWIWTEHHSRRLRVKLTVARDLVGASGSTYVTCLQQSLVVEYVVRTRNCDACNKVAAKDTWQAKVQVRQKTEHPRTLLALEQHMLKHQKSRVALREVKRVGDGLDFIFGRRQDAHRFALGVCALAPCKCKASSSLVSANAKTGTSNVRHVWAVEIAPLCRDDLVLLSKGVAPSLPPLALVSRIGASLHLVDPASGAAAEVTAEQYWRNPFPPLGTKRHLINFVVLDCELEQAAPRGAGPATPLPGAAPLVLSADGRAEGAAQLHDEGPASAGGAALLTPLGELSGLTITRDKPRKASRAASVAGSARGSVPGSLSGRSVSTSGRGYVAAYWAAGEATVVRESDFGANDEMLMLRTHLGALLAAGDEVIGYDLEAMSHAIDDARVDSGALQLPEAVLVGKKSRAEKRKQKKSGRRRRPTKKPLGDTSSEASSTAYQDSVLGDESVLGEEELELDGAIDLESLDRVMLGGEDGIPEEEEEEEEPGG